jgi:uncharacterized protein (DUF433 family)
MAWLTLNFHSQTNLIQKLSRLKIMAAGKRKEYGQYIVADSQVYGGQPTFKGTRIPVKDVLYLISKAWDWDRISAAYDGRISHEAIAEAVELACEALMKRTQKRQQAATGSCCSTGFSVLR